MPTLCMTIKIKEEIANLNAFKIINVGSNLIMLMIQNYNMQKADTLFYHRLIESYKWAYGARTLLGDPHDPEHRESIINVVRNITSSQWARDVFLRKIHDTKTFNDPSYYGASFYNVDDFGTSHISIIDQGIRFELHR